VGVCQEGVEPAPSRLIPHTGKLADFTVLDADPRDVEPMAIRDIPVIATIVGGRVILTADTRKP
jgi:hypothetical protein